MTRVVVSTDLAAPPTTVFAYMTDPERTREWAPKADYEGDAAIGPAASGVEIRRLGPLRIRIRWRVTAYEPPRRLGYRYDWGPLSVDVAYTAEGLAGTHLTCTADIRGPLAVLVAWSIRRDDEASFRRLKRAVEAR